MTTTQMAYFIAMAEKLSFTAVAEQFYVTQPTLSRQIMNLEAELETQLFVRRKNNVALTPAGEYLYDGLKPIYGQLERLLRSVRRFNEPRREVFVIGVGQELLMDVPVQLAIGQFSAEHPEVDVTIARSSYANLQRGLLDGSISVADTITSSFDMDSGMFGFLCIEEESVHLACSREMAKQLPTRLSIEEVHAVLRKNRLLLGRNEFFGQSAAIPVEVFKEAFGPMDFEPEIHMCNSPMDIPDQVGSGLGVSLCNRTNMFAIDPNTVIIGIDVEPKRGTVYPKGLLYSLGNPSTLLKHFLEIVERRCNTPEKKAER